MDKRIAVLKDVVRHPVKAFREIDKNSREYLTGALIIFILTASIFHLLSPQLFSLNRFFTGSFSLVLFIILIYYVGKFLKGTAEFSGLFSALGYSYIPYVFSSVIFGIIGRLNTQTLSQIITQEQAPRETIALFKELFTPMNISLGFLGLVAGIWGLILAILACRESHKFSTGRAAGTIIITGFVIAIILNLLKSIV